MPIYRLQGFLDNPLAAPGDPTYLLGLIHDHKSEKALFLARSCRFAFDTLLNATNRLPEPEPLMHHALAIDEASLGFDHPRIAIQLNNLARLLKDTNQLSEAEPADAPCAGHH